jgi:adenosylhomocysteine nucleosidase
VAVRPALILTGIEPEARALARALALPRLHRRYACFGNEGLRVAAVGLAASLLEQRFSELLADLGEPLVVSAGLCAGLSPELRVGDLVIPARVVDAAGQAHEVRATLPGSSSRGTLVTVARVLASPEAKAALHAQTGALAADMESAPILAMAERAGLAALAVRAVSDAAEDALPAALVGVLDAAGRVRPARFLVGALRQPSLVGRALALQRGSRAALARVAAALGPLLR